MNKILISYILILVTFQLFGQTSESTPDFLQMTETDSLYLKAIEKYTVQIESFYNKYLPSNRKKIIYINYEDFLTKLPKNINSYQIVLLDKGNRKEYFKKSKNKLRLVNVTPLSIKDKRFFISLTPYFAELKSRNKLYLSISDWTIIYFDWIDGKLVYAETENNGI
jgi:hypothetical protein